jgi:hypothetical protein
MYGVCPGSSIEYEWRRQTASENRVNRVGLGGGGDRRNWKRLSPVRQSVSHGDMYVVLRNTTLGIFGGETVLLSAVCLVSLLVGCLSIIINPLPGFFLSFCS